MTTVAALYIDEKGPYPRMNASAGPWPRIGLTRIDLWPASRDARLYEGPWPVIAHPPCRHWGRLRHLAHVGCWRCGSVRPEIIHELVECSKCGSRNVASDADCAPRAVEQVRRWGGVLEHPAGSLLWEHCGLPIPGTHSNDCVCNGEKWLWGHELLEPPDVVTDTRYTCDRDGADSFGGYTIEVDQVEWGHVARKRTWLYLVGVPREALEAPPFPGREPTHYIGGGRTPSSRNGGAIPPGMKAASTQQKNRTPPLFAEYLVRLGRAAGEAWRAA